MSQTTLENAATRVNQRSYRSVLDELGPSPYSAPEAPVLSATNADGDEVTLEHFAGRNVVLIYYLGDQCVHCIEQLQLAEERFGDFQSLDTEIVAISKDPADEIAEYQADYSLLLLSDPDFSNARRYGSYDDFEEAELHSTLLLDSEGRIHWARVGGDPFTDFDFLLREAAKLAN